MDMILEIFLTLALSILGIAIISVILYACLALLCCCCCCCEEPSDNAYTERTQRRSDPPRNIYSVVSFEERELASTKCNRSKGRKPVRHINVIINNSGYPGVSYYGPISIDQTSEPPSSTMASLAKSEKAIPSPPAYVCK